MKLIVLIVCLSLLSAAVVARDLHAVAKKERARREALRSSSRPFTNEDLAAYAAHREPNRPVPRRGAAPSAPERDLEKEESYWRRQKLGHERDLARLDARIRKLEWRLRDHRRRRRLKGGSRDDPSTEMIEESLESLREERKKMEMDFRERARKARAFPGWLR